MSAIDDLPPLRDRTGDIPILVEHFLGKLAHDRGRPSPSFSPAALERLAQHTWPGNVRELENEIERLVVLAGDELMIGTDLLSPRIRQWTPTETLEIEAEPDSLPAAVEALERALKLDARRSFAEDALARLVLAHEALHEQQACVRARERYFARYPEGVHAAHLAGRCTNVD